MVQCSAHVVIDANLDRVWRALSDPREVPQWDSNLAHPLDVPPNYPHLTQEQEAQWKYWLGPFPCVLHDRPFDVVARQTYASNNRVAFIRFRERYTLHAVAPAQTQVDFVVSIWTTIPILGPGLDRLALKPITDKTIAASLKKLRQWCETHPS